MSLTDKMKAMGWRPISEIVNEQVPYNVSYWECLKVKDKQTSTWVACGVGLIIIKSEYEGANYYRRLIPAPTTPQIVLSVEDARYIRDLIYQHDIELTTGEEAILDQLEPDITKLRNVIGKAMK